MDFKKEIDALHKAIEVLTESFQNQNQQNYEALKGITDNIQGLIEISASRFDTEEKMIKLIREINDDNSDEVKLMAEQGNIVFYATCKGFDVPEHAIILTILGDELAKIVGGKFMFSVPSIGWSHVTHMPRTDHHYWERLIRPVADSQLKANEVPYIALALANFEPNFHMDDK